MKGCCHCGTIEFYSNGNPKIIVNCHCDECKKRNGSPYSTYIAINEGDFEIAKGAEEIQTYVIANEGEKHFCSKCGSPIYNNNYRYPGLYMLFYGAGKDPESFIPSHNVFCESKHDWVDTIADMHSFHGPIGK